MEGTSGPQLAHDMIASRIVHRLVKERRIDQERAESLEEAIANGETSAETWIALAATSLPESEVTQ